MHGQVLAALEGVNNLKEYVSNVTRYMFLDYLKDLSLKQTHTHKILITEKGTVRLFPKWDFSKTEYVKVKLRPG